MKLTINGGRLNGPINVISSVKEAAFYVIASTLSETLGTIRCEANDNNIISIINNLRILGADISYSAGNYYVQKGNVNDKLCFDFRLSDKSFYDLFPLICSYGIKATIKKNNRAILPLYVEKELTEHGVITSGINNCEFILNGSLNGGRIDLSKDKKGEFIPGFLIACPNCRFDSSVILPDNFKDISTITTILKLLDDFRIEYNINNSVIDIKGNQVFKAPANIEISCDKLISSFWTAVQELTNDNVCVSNLDNISEDSIQLIEQFISDKKVYFDMSECYDLLPVVAVLSSILVSSCSFLINIPDEKYDRMVLFCQSMKKIGFKYTLIDGGVKIYHTTFISGSVNAHKLPEVVIASALASVQGINIEIIDAESFSSIYPSFLIDFRRLGGVVSFE